MNNLFKVLINPVNIIKSFFLLFLYKFFKDKVFSYSQKYRSDSDNGYYVSTVLEVLKSQKSFENFKRNFSYQKIIEHVSKNQGLEYLKILEKRKDGDLERALKTSLVTDNVGNPIKFFYDGYDILLSPTTLRYVKVSSDLKKIFGKKIGNVAEIGCGYGGQTLVNDQLLDINFTKLFDLPEVNRLIERYLNYQIIKGAYKTTVINQEPISKYDLVISNYAFSELPIELQNIYIDKVLSHSSRGYITMNSGLSGFRSEGKLSLNDLRKRLPKFKVFEEEPLTSKHNYIIAWGFDEKNIYEILTLKKI